MGSQLLRIYDFLIVKRPIPSLIITFVIVGFFFYQIPKFKLDASADSLVLENDKDLRFYRQITERYGTKDYLLITYTPKEELFSETALADLKQLRDELKQLDGVESVLTILDVPLLFSPKIALGDLSKKEKIKTLEEPNVDKELAKNELLNSPLYRKRLLSRDGGTTAVLVKLPVDLTYRNLLKKRYELREKKYQGELTPEETIRLQSVSEAFRQYVTELTKKQNKLVEAIRGILARHRTKADLYLGGVPMIVADLIAFIKNDLVVFGVSVFIFLIITLIVIFRKPRWVVLPMLCCLIAVFIMMGYLGLMDWRVTVISSNFISLMLILTLSMMIHLIVRYRELHALQPHAAQRTLVLETVRSKVMPCLYTTLTTIVAFISLLVSNIRPVMDFGMMMTMGLVVSFVLAFILFPAGVMLLKKDKPKAIENSTSSFTLFFAHLTKVEGRKILILSMLLAILSGIGIYRLKVENRFIDYFRETTEIYQGMKVIDQKLGGTTPLDIIIDFKKEEALFDEFDEEEDFFEEEEENNKKQQWFTSSYKMGQIEKIHDYLDGLSETGEVLSFATTMKVVTKLNNDVSLDDFELALMHKWIPEDIRKILINPYIFKDEPQARLTLRIMESNENLDRKALLEKIHDFIVNQMGFADEQIHFTNMFVLYNNMLQSLFRSQILTIGAVFLGIMIMFTILFRSFFLALIAIIPNLLPAALVLGTMGWLGIPLDMMTITIAAITIGIAVDDTIHYIHRFQKEFIKDRNYLATVYRCHGSIGRAMYYTSVTIIIGFSILLLSNFIPTIYFGLFTGFAMLAALLAALTLLPELLIILKPLGPEQQT